MTKQSNDSVRSRQPYLTTRTWPWPPCWSQTSTLSMCNLPWSFYYCSSMGTPLVGYLLRSLNRWRSQWLLRIVNAPSSLNEISKVETLTESLRSSIVLIELAELFRLGKGQWDGWDARPLSLHFAVLSSNLVNYFFYQFWGATAWTS